MKNYKISISGDLGSGKSTVAELLVNKLNLKRISAGGMQREAAKKRGMSIEEFNRYMETHPELDRELDAAIGEYEHIDGDFIFDSRLAWHFVPSSLSVYLKVSPQIAAERIFNANRNDENFKTVEQTVESIVARRKSELLRYKNFYNLNLDDESNYDLVIDTTDLTPEEVAEKVINKLQQDK